MLKFKKLSVLNPLRLCVKIRLFPILHPLINQERPEGNQCRHKNQHAPPEGPAILEEDIGQHEGEEHKEQPVNPAHPFDGHRLSGQVFQGHGNEEQNQKGNSFGQGQETQRVDGVTKHKANLAQATGCSRSTTPVFNNQPFDVFETFWVQCDEDQLMSQSGRGNQKIEFRSGSARSPGFGHPLAINCGHRRIH